MKLKKIIFVLIFIFILIISGQALAETNEIIMTSYVKKEVINTENRIKELKKDNTMSFSFITDTHGDRGEYATLMNIEAFRKLGTGNLLDFGIHAGDMTTGEYEDLSSGKTLYNLEFYTKMLTDTNIPTLILRGNHDCNTRKGAEVAISGKQFYETALKHLENEVVFNKDDLGGDYYYKDLEDKKIRVCALNAFNGENYEFIFGDKQLEFVAKEVLDLSNKENPEEWQILFLSHTVDESEAHNETPSDNEKLYSIINAFQEGKKETIGNIEVDYTNQGKGTVIAIITGHHHLDSTIIKNNLLIITVRSASLTYDRLAKNGQTYDEEDLCFDVFTIDKESKTIYTTRVGRGNDRKWSYDINNLQEQETETRTKSEIKENTTNKIEAKTLVDIDNNLIAIVTSDTEFKEKTNKTWILSKDKKTYIKYLDDVSDPYTTSFTNINGYKETITFEIDKNKDKNPPKLELKYQDNQDGTYTAIVTSNEILKEKTNKDWKLSEDRHIYQYVLNQDTVDYTTTFSDIFENGTSLKIDVNDAILFINQAKQNEDSINQKNNNIYYILIIAIIVCIIIIGTIKIIKEREK